MIKVALCLLSFLMLFPHFAQAQATLDFPVVELRSLDKVTARTVTFEAAVGQTIKFGSLYIKVRACRKSQEMEKPEAASFMQVWEVEPDQESGADISQWVFSGWMFSSSPGLSSMDHPIYDVWVLDCLETKDQRAVPAQESEQRDGEGDVSGDVVPAQPAIVE